jgi:hypothetical protein
VIFEAILGVEGPRFAPMGVEPGHDGAASFFEAGVAVIRPFFSSRTGEEFLRLGHGVLNFPDDVMLFAKTALTDELPPSRGPVIDGTPYWWKISAASAGRDEASGRWEIVCRVEQKNFERPFRPFNRAKNAALEAVILATRLHLEENPAEAMRRIGELETAAERTGGGNEHDIFRFIRSSVERGS